MRRQVRWTERLADGGKLQVRVTVRGETVKWQFKRADEDTWDYDSQPTDAQWDMLEEKVSGRYRRGQVALDKPLALIRRTRSGE